MTKKPSRPVSTEGKKPLLPTAAPLLLTIKAAAAYLGITHYSLRNLVTTRQLPCVQLSRRILIDPVDLKELVAERKTFYTKTARRPPRDAVGGPLSGHRGGGYDVRRSSGSGAAGGSNPEGFQQLPPEGTPRKGTAGDPA